MASASSPPGIANVTDGRGGDVADAAAAAAEGARNARAK